MDEICQDVLRARLESFLYTAINHLMGNPDHGQDSQKDRSKTNKTRINITINADGEPDIPSVTMGDGYQTKIVQATLREYCTAHIRELGI
jgi:uncharacterized protein (DUF4415 family)